MAQPEQVLVVDDDPQIRELLCSYLADFGMQADAAADGRAMRKALAAHRYDAVILDVMLPGEDGLSLCRELRSHASPAHAGIAILMLTARGESLDRIIGLELGADDYIPKPFEPRELLARLRAVLRRAPGERERAGASGVTPGDLVCFDGWSLDRIARQVTTPDRIVVPLSNAEFRLLSVFIEHVGRVVSRDLLMDAMHGRSAEPFDRSIDLLVSRLRIKLHDKPRTPHLLRTVRGEGYLFDAKVTR